MANLEDICDVTKLIKNDFCGMKYGEHQQLEINWCNGLKDNKRKYILKCSICSQDPELHGEGYFISTKGHLDRGCLPCGCSSKNNWTEEQYIVRAKRQAEKKGLVFLGWYGEFKTANRTRWTRCSLECPEHGIFNTSTLSFLLANTPKGCRGCFAIRMGNFKRKEDEEMISQFMATGCYHPDTKFYRSDRLDKNGHLKYWYMDCPECGETAEGHLVGLYQGVRSCSCTTNRQKQAYINLIKEGDTVVAIKYGVANLYTSRVLSQNNKSIYDVENYGVWEFPEVIQCKGAERTCSTTLDRGVISKEEMQDGHTETTHTTNLEQVVSIYEEYGGIRIV